MDILNFISWIRGRRTVSTVDPNNTLLPVGIRNPTRDDLYTAGAISVTDFAAQLGNPQQAVGTTIWANGFRVVGCIGEDIVLPENSNLEFTGPLAMCVGSTLTIPVGTTLTIL